MSHYCISCYANGIVWTSIRQSIQDMIEVVHPFSDWYNLLYILRTIPLSAVVLESEVSYDSVYQTGFRREPCDE